MPEIEKPIETPKPTETPKPEPMPIMEPSPTDPPPKKQKAEKIDLSEITPRFESIEKKIDKLIGQIEIEPPPTPAPKAEKPLLFDELDVTKWN